MDLDINALWKNLPELYSVNHQLMMLFQYKLNNYSQLLGYSLFTSFAICFHPAAAMVPSMFSTNFRVSLIPQRKHSLSQYTRFILVTLVPISSPGSLQTTTTRSPKFFHLCAPNLHRNEDIVPSLVCALLSGCISSNRRQRNMVGIPT